MVKIPDKKAKIIETLSNCENISDPEQHYAELIQKKKDFQNDKEKELLDIILEALGNSERLLILDALKDRDLCVCELEAIMDKAQASVSHHLRILEQAGLIRGWKKGKFTHYSLMRTKCERFTEILTRWIADTRNWFGDFPP